jgi:hypothetical protein
LSDVAGLEFDLKTWGAEDDSPRTLVWIPGAETAGLVALRMDGADDDAGDTGEVGEPGKLRSGSDWMPLGSSSV